MKEVDLRIEELRNRQENTTQVLQEVFALEFKKRSFEDKINRMKKEMAMMEELKQKKRQAIME